jgi:hypothetical protein
VRVKLNTILAGPDIGPFDIGQIVDLPVSLAVSLVRTGNAVAVDPLPVPREDKVETAIDSRDVETAARRGPGRPRKAE